MTRNVEIDTLYIKEITLYILKTNFSLLFRFDNSSKEVTIALVGKYTKLEDSYISVMKALYHAGMHCRTKVVIKVSTGINPQVV